MKSDGVHGAINAVREALLDGPIDNLGILRDFFTDEPRGTAWAAYLPSQKGTPWGNADYARATGGHGDEQTAILKTVMEAAERLCLSTVPTSSMKRATASELDNEVTKRPRELGTPWSESEHSRIAMHWVRAQHLETREHYVLPAQIFYCPYQEDLPQANIWEPNSSGAAAGFDQPSALRRAVSETFERHVTMSAHYYQLRGRSVSWKSLNLTTSAARMATESHALGLRIRLSIMATTPLAVVVCVVEDASGVFPRITTGSSADRTVDNAASDALMEAIFARRQVRDFLGGQIVKTQSDKLETIEQRVTYWGQENSSSELEHLFGREIEYDRHPLHASSLSSGYFADITSPTIQALGITVVKVHIPSLRKIFFNEERLRHSWTSSTLLTRAPHPYA